MRNYIPVLTMAALAAACAANPAPVRLTADPAGQALVIGEWSGDYYAADQGRSGSMLIRFERHDPTEVVCFGDVVLVPRVQNQPGDDGRDPSALEPVRVLAIDHVDVQGADITGKMAPYEDPDTGESLTTWFEGRISGDKMSGMLYTIHARSGERTSGKWEVTRSKTSVPEK